MVNIKRLSNFALLIIWCSLFCVFVFNSAYWIFINHHPDASGALVFNIGDLQLVLDGAWTDSLIPKEITLPLSNIESLTGYIPYMLPKLAVVYLLWSLIKLFRLYRDGNIFLTDNVKCYKNISYILIAIPFIEMISSGLLGLVTTYGQDDLMFSVNFSSSYMDLFLVGIVVRVISHVMDMASNIHEENMLTV
ncbi:DUF2975 domain-containing protein [Shewanella gelidimarina]|uniref:DUF2975 domain-containing protein n=1 Tax=Shewanella gelidimarina TaxID=56813 RepID=UPI00200CB6E4|nr:DUF2975 domain-containing protein [Shewanella gelidimarina]MCL1060119.1 DUF2975 domain-containing protein [Shewanella gelidimarina]